VSGESVCISVSGRHYKGTISGEGGVDFKFIFSTLKNNGYKGWLSVEFEGVEEQQSGSIRSVENIVNIVKNL
jgi:sugar phosphate isomerase/epimerase